MSAERRVTGWSAVGGGLLSFVMIGLYFLYSGPPPQANVLTRNLITLTTFAAFLVFAVGLSRLLREAADQGALGDGGLAADVAVAALRTYVTVTLVATSLEVGASLQDPHGRLDPTVDGPLAAGMALLHGPVARVLVAMFLLALACAPGARALFSRRVLRLGVALAGVNLALVPSLFFGMDAARFYAANGWGSVASIGALNVAWLIVLGRSILRTGRPADDDAWEGTVVRTSRGALDGSNLYRRVRVRLDDATERTVRVDRAVWRRIEVGDRLTKESGGTFSVAPRARGGSR